MMSMNLVLTHLYYLIEDTLEVHQYYSSVIHLGVEFGPVIQVTVWNESVWSYSCHLSMVTRGTRVLHIAGAFRSPNCKSSIQDKACSMASKHIILQYMYKLLM